MAGPNLWTSPFWLALATGCAQPRTVPEPLCGVSAPEIVRVDVRDAGVRWIGGVRRRAVAVTSDVVDVDGDLHRGTLHVRAGPVVAELVAPDAGTPCALSARHFTGLLPVGDGDLPADAEVRVEVVAEDAAARRSAAAVAAAGVFRTPAAGDWLTAAGPWRRDLRATWLAILGVVLAAGVALWAPPQRPPARPRGTWVDALGLAVALGTVGLLALPWLIHPTLLMEPDQLRSLPGSGEPFWHYWPRDPGRPSRLTAPWMWAFGQVGGVAAIRASFAALAGVAVVALWRAGASLGWLAAPLLTATLLFRRGVLEVMLMPRAYALPITLSMVALAAPPRWAVVALSLAVLDDPSMVGLLLGYGLGLLGSPHGHRLALACVLGAAGGLALGTESLGALRAVPSLVRLWVEPVPATLLALGAVAAVRSWSLSAGAQRARALAAATGALALVYLFLTGRLTAGPRYAFAVLPFLVWAWLAGAAGGGLRTQRAAPAVVGLRAAGTVLAMTVVWLVWAERVHWAQDHVGTVLPLAGVATAAVGATATRWPLRAGPRPGLAVGTLAVLAVTWGGLEIAAQHAILDREARAREVLHARVMALASGREVAFLPAVSISVAWPTARWLLPDELPPVAWTAFGADGVEGRTLGEADVGDPCAVRRPALLIGTFPGTPPACEGCASPEVLRDPLVWAVVCDGEGGGAVE